MDDDLTDRAAGENIAASGGLIQRACNYRRRRRVCDLVEADAKKAITGKFGFADPDKDRRAVARSNSDPTDRQPG